ncbi:MAG: class I SAM-dependent methyltransferase [Myxococcota bacterium]|nr:class I SAM-dependent methyltransferase [Myxococcota bacterium]
MMKHFDTFLAELSQHTPEREYNWSAQKEEACQWIIDRVVPGRGVDVGGTEYMCRKLAAAGRDITYYDLNVPREHPTFVQDDMANVLDHFEPGSLDFVTTRHTLEHSIAPLFQLWSFNRILKEGGQLLVVVPLHCKEWVWFHTHYSCLPQENWLMLFHRAGFKVHEIGAGTWNSKRELFVELRFDLRVESRALRLAGGAPAKR